MTKSYFLTSVSAKGRDFHSTILVLCGGFEPAL